MTETNIWPICPMCDQGNLTYLYELLGSPPIPVYKCSQCGFQYNKTPKAAEVNMQSHIIEYGAAEFERGLKHHAESLKANGVEFDDFISQNKKLRKKIEFLMDEKINSRVEAYEEGFARGFEIGKDEGALRGVEEKYQENIEEFEAKENEAEQARRTLQAEAQKHINQELELTKENMVFKKEISQLQKEKERLFSDREKSCESLSRAFDDYHKIAAENGELREQILELKRALQKIM